ncbi:MAG: rhamnulokinase, partial [Clostridia bacterium]|nr:rhamnulokinase [Clostridia bacterium]
MNLLGFDFGASSGRAMLGVFDGERIEIEEIHRFSNDPVMLCGRFVWDVPRLVYEMKQALLKLSRTGLRVDAIGIDTWGVDFGMLDKNGHLLGLPVHYRDDRTLGMREKVREIIPDRELFAHTGLAYNQFNTLYQLYAMKLEGDPVLEKAADMLFMPDLLAYFLTGRKGTEYTVASTSELINPYTRDWDIPLMEKLGLPTGFLGAVKLPGTVRGTLLPDIAKECGVDEIPVIAIGGHDTASAVAAVPAREKDFAYISSGTWSLLGAEIDKPLCAESVMNANYTNEGGVDGSIRLLKNIMGLWIIQECKREWDRRSDAVGFAELVEMAMRAPAFKAIVDVDDPCFMAPGDMPNRIQAYCERTGQAVPQGRGEISRVIYESLALKYRYSIERLEEVLGHPIKVLHIVGGGSKNALLNKFTAEAIKRPVVAGPGEGTVIGNLLMQAVALGEIKDIPALRRVVEASFPTETFAPETDGAAWDKAYEEYTRRFA